MPSQYDIASEILRFAGLRGRSSFCPSEVARSLASAGSEEEWRALMPSVREEAAGLSRRGWLVATQRGAPVSPTEARGPIRLRASEDFLESLTKQPANRAHDKADL